MHSSDSSKSAPHRARRVTWNKMPISHMQEGNKRRRQRLLRTAHVPSIHWDRSRATWEGTARKQVCPDSLRTNILKVHRQAQVRCIITLVLQMKTETTQTIKIHPKSHSQQMADGSQLTSKPGPFHGTRLFLSSAFSVPGTLPSASHAPFHLRPQQG